MLAQRPRVPCITGALRLAKNLLQMRLDCREKAEEDWNPVRLSKMLREILAEAP